MNAVEFIALLLGSVYVAVGLGMLVDSERYRGMAEEFFSSPALTYLGGIMAFAAGVTMVYLHHAWTADWRVIVTVIGWLALVKGVLLLVLPSPATRLWTPLLHANARLRAVSVPVIGLGLVLLAGAFGWL
ncbi:MAG: hypothetical protein R3233_00870 [Xanthomonadales bacterium]|nr:hypothetical protein [Xanthomonadales bacterium]